MAAESKFQSTVVRWLRQKGCFVLVTTPGAGIPTGTPDVIALFPGGGWAALEIKPGKTARFQPLQKATVQKLDALYFSRVVYPENWPAIQEELRAII